jgi:hypothetical protein
MAGLVFSSKSLDVDGASPILANMVVGDGRFCRYMQGSSCKVL